MIKRILITGGSGFIGTSLIKLFEKLGSQVLNIDIHEPKLSNQFKYWFKCDVCDKTTLQESVLKFNPTHVVHLAARTDLNGKTLEDYKSNIEGTKVLIEVLRQLDSLDRVIFTSSMYVCRPGYQPSNDLDFFPHTKYGESKVISEEIVRASNLNFNWCIIRPTSIWGPNFGEPYNLFFKLILSGRYYNIGAKACIKTYGFIDNFIIQVLGLLNADLIKFNNKLFYLGDYEPYNITEWANEIAEIEGINIPNPPFYFFKLLAYFGDFVGLFGFKFAMTSFRLKNMTTDNFHNLDLIKDIVPCLPVSRIEGSRETINWLKNSNLYG